MAKKFPADAARVVTPVGDEQIFAARASNGEIVYFTGSALISALVKLKTINNQSLIGNGDITISGAMSAAQIRTALGISTLSGNNTGDQDLSGLQPKVSGKGLSTEDFTSALKSKLESLTNGGGGGGADISRDTILSLLGISNITGLNTGDQDLGPYRLKTDTSGLSDRNYTAAEQAKLAGVQPNASQNSNDASLRNRATHTGTQAATTITEDATHRFATDAEKVAWNAKATPNDISTAISNLIGGAGSDGNTLKKLADRIQELQDGTGGSPGTGERYLFSPSVSWGDEFSYTGAPDPDKWRLDIGNGYSGWGNNELQYFTGRNDNVKVEDGVLKVIARQEGYQGFNYTSGKLVTGKIFRYGRLVISAKFPLGTGLWPAFFMFGDRHKSYDQGTWPACGELDIIEARGQNPNQVNFNIHTTNDHAGVRLDVAESIGDFNEYRIDWTPEYIRWFFNGRQLHEFVNDGSGHDHWPFSDYFDLILALNVGGGFVGSDIDNSKLPATMEVQHVRYYELININKTAKKFKYPIKPVLDPPEATIPYGQSQTFTINNVPAGATVAWYGMGVAMANYGITGNSVTITPELLYVGGITSGGHTFEVFAEFVDAKGNYSEVTVGKLTIT